MDQLLHTRDQRTVKTVDFKQGTYSEECEDCPISQKGHGHNFLGFLKVLFCCSQQDNTLRNSRKLIPFCPSQGQNGTLLKNGHIWDRKRCSSTMTTRQLTHMPLPWRIWPSWATKCCPIHLILQIRFRVISSCFPTWESHSPSQISGSNEAYFAAQEKTYFSDGINKLLDRWVKCLKLKGEYYVK